MSATTRSTTGTPRRGRANGRPRRGEGRFALWLVLPTLVLLATVIAYPVLQAIVRSFFSDSITGDTAFVGLDNYTRFLTGPDSGAFWDALNVTVFFTVVSVLLETVIGVSMALAMNRVFRGRGVVRAAVLVPWAIPTAVCAVLWRWTFDANGIVNHLIGTQILWTGSEWPAKFAIIFADTWKTAPFIALLVLARLQMIPKEVHEAATVDGAGRWRRFTAITLPLVWPALVVAVLFRMMDVLRIYDLPQIFTGGANDTTTLSMLVVREAIGNLKPGLGGALSTVTFLFIFACAFAFIRALGANVMPGRQEDM